MTKPKILVTRKLPEAVEARLAQITCHDTYANAQQKRRSYPL